MKVGTFISPSASNLQVASLCSALQKNHPYIGWYKDKDGNLNLKLMDFREMEAVQTQDK